VLLGSGTLAPWNAWLLAYRYLDTVFGQERDVQYVSGRVRWNNFSRWSRLNEILKVKSRPWGREP
jgi:hypothetical protein